MSHYDGYVMVQGMQYSTVFRCAECGALLLSEDVKLHKKYHTWADGYCDGTD